MSPIISQITPKVANIHLEKEGYEDGFCTRSTQSKIHDTPLYIKGYKAGQRQLGYLTGLNGETAEAEDPDFQTGHTAGLVFLAESLAKAGQPLPPAIGQSVEASAAYQKARFQLGVDHYIEDLKSFPRAADAGCEEYDRGWEAAEREFQEGYKEGNGRDDMMKPVPRSAAYREGFEKGRLSKWWKQQDFPW